MTARFTASFADAPVTSAPIAGSSGVILQTIDATGSASGAGATSGAVAPYTDAAGVASGTGDATADSVVYSDAAGAASGSGTAAAVTSALSDGAGSASGTGDLSGDGAPFADAIGSGSGTGSSGAAGAPYSDSDGAAFGSGDAGAGTYAPSSFLHTSSAFAGAPVAVVAVSGSDGLLDMASSGSAAGAAGSASGSGDAVGEVDALYFASPISRFTAVVADAPVAAVPVSGMFGCILTVVGAAGAAVGAGSAKAESDYSITPLGACQIHAKDTYMYPGGGGAPSPPSSYERKKRRRKPRVLNASPKPLATGLDATTTVIVKPKEPEFVNIDSVLRRLSGSQDTDDADDDDEVMALILELAA